MTSPAPGLNTTITPTRHKLRVVTAASLFDGHDAAINIMRRILQSSGVEVIHLGHNRSVRDVVDAVIQEDARAVAISSYQGGHIEYFTYLRELLNERGAGDVCIFGGGGGVIVAEEIARLEAAGITRIFSPEHGRRLGLQGMINEILEKSDYERAPIESESNPDRDRKLARLITQVEEGQYTLSSTTARTVPVVGITGPGGAGKSSLGDELCLRLLEQNPTLRVAVLAIDPTRRKTGGALLGDRIRMNAPALFPERMFVRSMATREAGRSLSDASRPVVELLKAADFDLIFVETSGTGQSDADIVELVDIPLYVMTAEFGAPTQLEKIAMLDYAELVALNKSEKQGSEDALQYVRKQVQRNRASFASALEDMPVVATTASRFNDPGVNRLYNRLVALIAERGFARLQPIAADSGIEAAPAIEIIPGRRVRYLAEIAEGLRSYHTVSNHMADRAGDLQSLERTRELVPEVAANVEAQIQDLRRKLDPVALQWLERWPELRQRYRSRELSYEIRGRTLRQELRFQTLSDLEVPLVALPDLESWRELLRYYYRENLPGHFPYTASVFPFRKAGEDPTRMFAGEGGPERTNVRFHYLTAGTSSSHSAVARLSTAFDSVTLYGEDPAVRPDIYGKIGNSGVSVPTLDDCKRLYSGFDLCAAGTSVSMTINGPAPMLLAFFLNSAIDQQVERSLAERGELETARETIAAHYRGRGLPVPGYGRPLPPGHNGLGLALLGMAGDRLIDPESYARIKTETIERVRGTVQADILKEDQAQNTCIFSTPFALRMMGDIQQYFVANRVRNFYSVSISGYHIAEAGANPITQLAFTLANGFTYVEYYLKRGLSIDDFAANLSFFFSNGLDPEYSVIGRVARRIWAVTLRDRYGANERSCKLKYHIQTSGRSLHAREIDFNDIRTTLQALYALYDNCNSLHTNAFDEAITTPTEASVRRAMAIQLIINRELGLNKNQNPIQGAYIIGELTDLVEEAVLSEFERISERGGVPGAMETMYQRARIQEESLRYEHMKHTGELPIIGVNTFLRETEEEQGPIELIRSTEEEKKQQIERVHTFQAAFPEERDRALCSLKEIALQGKNIFEELMETVKVASLGDISAALYQVGGSYRRNV